MPRPPARHRSPGVARPGLAKAWTATAVALAAAGINLALPEPSRPGAEYFLAPNIRPLSSGTAMEESLPVEVHIPALGVTSAVMPLGLEDDGSMEVPPAAYPAGWYERGPTPGEVGPAVLVGHVDWADQDGVFAHLVRLQRGDVISVDRDDGSVATFAVERVARYPKNGFPTDEVYGDVDVPALRLITCGGVFDEDSGNYEDNVVVFASLTG